MLGGGDRVPGRGVDDHHARAGRRLDVDPVDPDARHADDAQPRGGGIQELGVDARLRADDERVPAAVVPQRIEEVAARQPEADLAVVCGGKSVEPGLGHGLDDEDAGHVGPSLRRRDPDLRGSAEP